MTFLTERLADLRRQLDHLRDLRQEVRGPESLEGDLSLHNDVLFALLVVCQRVIDIAGELAAREGIRFQDYTEAVRALRRLEPFTDELVEPLVGLPGFRNILIHGYVELDYGRALRALEELEPLERFVETVADLEAQDDSTD